jgi:hypothetical protein
MICLICFQQSQSSLVEIKMAPPDLLLSCGIVKLLADVNADGKGKGHESSCMSSR